MAASSHDAGVRNLPYNAFQNNSDKHHLYASLTSWAAPQSISQPSNASSLMFQRPGSSTHQAPANLSQYSGPVDYANLQHLQTSWPSYRAEPVYEENFPSRPTEHYGYASTELPATRANTDYARPPALSSVRDLSHALPQDALSLSQRGQESHLPTYAAPADAPTFNTSAQGSAPVARILNYPPQGTGALQVQAPEFPPPSSLGWQARPDNAVVHTSSQGYHSNNPTVAFTAGLDMVTGSVVSNIPSWSATAVDASADRPFDRVQVLESEWAGGDGRHEHPVQVHQVAPRGPVSLLDPPQYAPAMTVALAPLTQMHRRPGVSQKLPTMPSPFVERQKKNTVSKRSGPLSKEKRDKAHRMRKRGPDGKPPCIRCRFYKAGCDEGDPCAKCEKTSKSARVFHLPCCRDQIEDTNLVRRCNGRWNQTEAEFLKYPWRKDKNIHVMDIIWNLPGFGPVMTAQPLRIKFREYEPEGSISDSTESQWQNTSGQLVKVEQPPYAVYDTAALQNDVEAYFTYNLPSVDQWIFGRNRHDEIALLTYREALRLRNQQGPGSELINLALQLQYLSIVSQGYGSVWSTNIPGIRQYDFRAMGHSDYEAYDRNTYDRPLPIAINHQMDVALVKFLKRLEDRCFKLLAKEIFKQGIRPWYELFLTLFVLFWNLEYIHSGAEGYIKSKYGTHIAIQVSNVVSRQIEKWDFSFEVLMNHWQGCLRNFKPFILARENPEELRNKGRLPDENAFQYMIAMAAILDRKGPSRFPPPLTGFAPARNSLSSKWIMALIKEAGG